MAKRGRSSMAMSGSTILTQAERKLPMRGWAPWRSLGSQSGTKPWCECSEKCLKMPTFEKKFKKNAYI